MFDRLKDLASGTALLLELRGLRSDLGALRAAGERIADAMEVANAHQWPQVIASEEAAERETEVTFVDEQIQAEYMDIELRLTTALGMPPSEEEIEAEYALRQRGRRGQ